MDVLFLVVDSLRAHPFRDGRVAATPFFDSLPERALAFSRAYASECWTLPSHVGMFTGLMPSEHRAHFHSMAYCGVEPTLAEILAARGYETECATRNFVFDGTIPGVNRGFARQTRILSAARRLDPAAVAFAVAKPRLLRHLRETGFFHPRQRENVEFARTFARSLQPADELLLEYLATRMAELRRRGQSFFLFANLYDVHAPYAPGNDSLTRQWTSPAGALENLMTPYALSRLGRHRYLRSGFRLSEPVRAMLEGRYRRAVELMDGKLARFFGELESRDLLDETMVILVSDHGEGFGEHGLYLHDGSLYQTHLHVPLWIFMPTGVRGRVADVVSTRDLFGLVERATRGDSAFNADTLLDPEYRARHATALAQHFHYRRVRDALPVYRSNQFAAVGARYKLLVRGGETVMYDLQADPDERSPLRASWADAVAAVTGKQDNAVSALLEYGAAAA